MRKFILALTASAIALSAGYSFAETAAEPKDKATIEASAESEGGKSKREPIDLETFSRMDELKAADSNGDGTLSRDEIEAHALAQIVKRTADRMERRLDVNRDGKVTIAEIEGQKAKRFALLDANDDGTLDRDEMRAAKKHDERGHGGKGGSHEHGKRFHRASH